MYSPAYFTPFALYGSGSRSPRIFAATSPTASLSIPDTLSFCGVSTVNVTPAGGSTPLGTVTGSLPILLMLYLPNVRQNLAAEALALRFAAGHEARGGRDDGDAKPAEHARHLGLPGVDAEARLRDAAQP